MICSKTNKNPYGNRYQVTSLTENLLDSIAAVQAQANAIQILRERTDNIIQTMLNDILGMVSENSCDICPAKCGYKGERTVDFCRMEILKHYNNI